MALVVPGVCAAIGLLLLMLSGWLWLRDPPRQLCPGLRIRWPMRLMPLLLVYRLRCGYDLRGHTPDARGMIVCPECGRHIRRKREMVRTPRAWRPARLACVFIACGLMIYRHPPLSALTIVQHTPTEMLLRGEGVLGVGTPLEVRDEIRRRAMDHQLDDQQISQLVRLLVNDLKNDQLNGNAQDALERLAIFGLFCETPLLEALESDDQQQRQMAVDLLRSMPSGHPAPEALLRACIEDLRADDRSRNARAGFRYLTQHAGEAEALLAQSMASNDPQQRLLCAAAAGCGGESGLMDLATPILVLHLADNQIEGDAIVAARALYGFGEPVLTLLEPYRHSADEQQRQAVEYIVRRMTTGDSPAKLQRELPRARLTLAAQDALVLPPEYLDMPTISGDW